MPTETKMFHLPDTMATWPWPRVINPHFEEVKAASDGWFRSLKAFSPKSQKSFERADLSRFGALAYPHASKEHLRTGCDLIYVGFVVDEYTDIENAEVTREMIEIAIDALNNPHKPRPEGEVILGEVVRQFWALAIKTASPTSQRHFVKHFTDYLHGVLTQSADRDVGLCRGIEDYLVVRRDNIGAQAAFVCLHLGVDFEDDVYYHPVIVELSGYVADMVLVDNDMCSYNREQATGDENHNLITAVMRELNIDLDSAMAWAANYHVELQHKFISGLKRVPSWGPTIDKHMQEYLDGMAYWARGNATWCFESERYFGKKGPEIQKTRMVPLLPKVWVNPELHRDEVVVADIEL
ncbi:terpenoid synthase [Leucogyrophana mollusca]|uniref:Terpenoid synthase n=1 Tax=Leucogyrophana mollusca TaxID=85980 RepID=A0ACB8BUE2_9AGAM|nr:terpenoid synthase [Leucogyrophana mollusca]